MPIVCSVSTIQETSPQALQPDEDVLRNDEVRPSVPPEPAVVASSDTELGPPQPWTRQGPIYRERLASIFNNITTTDTICGHIANGGTLVTLCEIWNVSYAHVTRWLRDDCTRQTRYEAALTDRAEWSKETILKELRLIATSDIRQLFNSDGTVKPVADWPPELSRAIASIEVDELFEGSGRDKTQIGITKKIKFWDKLKALELIGKNLIMWVEKLEHGTASLDVIIAGMTKVANNPTKGEISGGEDRTRR